ncbi:MAG: sulfotransferase [Myxococcota bacterium]
MSVQRFVDPRAPLPRPDWVREINREGGIWREAGMLSDMVPLDPESLLAAARRETGLDDFGAGDWREALEVLTGALESEADLNLMGRLCTRSELILWLRNRLKLVDLVARHPEIAEEPIEAPIFITGLPRTGTSILQELLWQDPRLRTPLFWETLHPVESARSGGRDEAARRSGDALIRQWIRVTPEIQTMHETAGDLPAEDATVWAYTLVSDHIQSFYQMPTYDAYVNAADPVPLYRAQKLFFQALQWRSSRRRWFGKTLYHLGHLPALFEVYPDARVIHTHRDPIRSMASVTNLLRAFYWQRSDRDFDAPGFEEITTGAGTADRLEAVMRLRDEGAVPADRIVDSRYQDLMDDPVGSIERLYGALKIPYDDEVGARVRRYLDHKPKHKHGVHRYKGLPPDELAKVRPLFRRYQARYGVPDET